MKKNILFMLALSALVISCSHSPKQDVASNPYEVYFTPPAMPPEGWDARTPAQAVRGFVPAEYLAETIAPTLRKSIGAEADATVNSVVRQASKAAGLEVADITAFKALGLREQTTIMTEILNNQGLCLQLRLSARNMEEIKASASKWAVGRYQNEALSHVSVADAAAPKNPTLEQFIKNVSVSVAQSPSDKAVAGSFAGIIKAERRINALTAKMNHGQYIPLLGEGCTTLDRQAIGNLDRIMNGVATDISKMKSVTPATLKGTLERKTASVLQVPAGAPVKERLNRLSEAPCFVFAH